VVRGSARLVSPCCAVRQDAGELYTYDIGGYGQPRTFRAPPATGPDAAFTFVVYGDMGESEHRAAKSPGCAASMSGWLCLRTLCHAAGGAMVSALARMSAFDW
jgi:hypothetical protein